MSMSPDDIKLLRVRLRFTQQQLAHKIGVTRATVSRWEMARGSYPVGRMSTRFLESLLKFSTREP